MWWADTGWLRARHSELLDEVESARSRALRRAADRARFVVGCALLRRVLGARLGMEPSRVPLDRTCPECGEPHGRPRLRRPIHISVSHAGTRVAVAVGPLPVGVDVERVDPALDLGPLAAAALTDGERAALGRLPPGDRAGGFLALWTRKEAVLKATGDGLNVDPRRVAVSDPAAAPRLLSFAGRPDLDATLVDLDPGPGYVATLAILGAWPVRQHDAGPLLRP